MANYENACGRLLAQLRKLSPGDKHLSIANFAERMGLPRDWDSVYQRLFDVNSLFYAIEEEVVLLAETAQRTLFQSSLARIREVTASFRADFQNKMVHFDFGPHDLIRLEHMAVAIPQSAEAEATDLNRINELCDELKRLIEEMEDAPKYFRQWLLNLVRIIRDSVERFEIYGTKGLRKQLSQVIGELVTNVDSITKHKSAKSTVFWSRLREVLEVMEKVASLGEKARTWISHSSTFMPMIAMGAS